MKCEVHYVIKNVRYRLLKVEGKTYLLDMDRSIWITLFPFLIWSLLNTVYQVDQEELNEKLQISNNKKKINKGNTLLLSGVGIFIANLLRPLGDYFNVSNKPLVNILLYSFFILLVMVLRLYISNKNKKAIYELVNLNFSKKERIWLKPESFKHFITIIVFYSSLVFFSLVSIVGFIENGNILALIFGVFLFICLSFFNIVTVRNGITKIEFKKVKNKA